MNNKGQTLLAFVLLLPVFIIFMAFVCDTGFVLKENTKLNNLTKTILKETQDDYDSSSYQDEIKKLYDLNDEKDIDLKINLKSDSKTIEITKNVPSIFGNVIGIKNYKISVKYNIKKENEKLVIEKE